MSPSYQHTSHSSNSVHRVRALCDKESLPDELEFLKSTFRENRYSLRQILSTLNPTERTSKPKDTPTLVTHLPYVLMTCGCLSIMLACCPRKISNFFCPGKDNLGLRTPGVYSIPCKCGQVYIGKTGRSIETRIKEHHRYIQLGHPNKSVVAEHRFNYDHLINLQDA